MPQGALFIPRWWHAPVDEPVAHHGICLYIDPNCVNWGRKYAPAAIDHRLRMARVDFGFGIYASMPFGMDDHPACRGPPSVDVRPSNAEHHLDHRRVGRLWSSIAILSCHHQAPEQRCTKSICRPCERRNLGELYGAIISRPPAQHYDWLRRCRSVSLPVDHLRLSTECHPLVNKFSSPRSDDLRLDRSFR